MRPNTNSDSMTVVLTANYGPHAATVGTKCSFATV